jgi:hypothetical protein
MIFFGFDRFLKTYGVCFGCRKIDDMVFWVPPTISKKLEAIGTTLYFPPVFWDSYVSCRHRKHWLSANGFWLIFLVLLCRLLCPAPISCSVGLSLFSIFSCYPKNSVYTSSSFRDCYTLSLLLGYLMIRRRSFFKSVPNPSSIHSSPHSAFGFTISHHLQ